VYCICTQQCSVDIGLVHNTNVIISTFFSPTLVTSKVPMFNILSVFANGFIKPSLVYFVSASLCAVGCNQEDGRSQVARTACHRFCNYDAFCWLHARSLSSIRFSEHSVICHDECSTNTSVHFLLTMSLSHSQPCRTIRNLTRAHQITSSLRSGRRICW